MANHLGRSRSRRAPVLRQEICDQLIESILNGRLPQGKRIVEKRLADQLGVSQAPVREALRDLELFGFVVSSPFRGSEVRTITAEELVDICPIRAALEGAAAREAARRIDDATLDRLEELMVEMRRATNNSDGGARAKADFLFHQTIVSAAGNQALEHIWKTMRLATMSFVTHAVTHVTRKPLLEISEGHRAILDALRTGDPSRAETAMRTHIEESGEWVRNELNDEAARIAGEALEESEPATVPG